MKESPEMNVKAGKKIKAAEDMFRTLTLNMNADITKEEMEEVLIEGVYKLREDSVSMTWLLDSL